MHVNNRYRSVKIPESKSSPAYFTLPYSNCTFLISLISCGLLLKHLYDKLRLNKGEIPWQKDIL
ncbi:hypothetical protein CbuG_0932 [Coxiella burnetii CbuG_Q212]|nr:hypothetical protein CbuG_0932 [Coxiella burnetii CbuG_Q212]